MAIKNPFTSIRESHERHLDNAKDSLSKATTDYAKKCAKERVLYQKEAIRAAKQKESIWNKNHK
jgi:ATP-dependent protease HslVU (ClpYQ) peptidase subunit